MDTGWPKGMLLIVRKERPHPGAQLRITDADGMRITCFATNTPDRPIAELELRHRLRARAEDRIRAARSTGLHNLPLHHTPQNKIWLEIVQIALDLLAWRPMLALTGQTRLWEPRRLRFRLFSAAAQLVTTAGAAYSASPATGPGPMRSQTPSNVLHSYRTPADQHPSRPYEGASTDRSSGTRRPPETTRGSSACPHQPQKAKRPTDSVGGPPRKIEDNARIWEPSTAARVKSRAFAPRSLARRTSCRRGHAPAWVHSPGRRQQLRPGPKPSSCGRCSQAIPV